MLWMMTSAFGSAAWFPTVELRLVWTESATRVDAGLRWVLGGATRPPRPVVPSDPRPALWARHRRAQVALGRAVGLLDRTLALVDLQEIEAELAGFTPGDGGPAGIEEGR